MRVSRLGEQDYGAGQYLGGEEDSLSSRLDLAVTKNGGCDTAVLALGHSTRTIGRFISILEAHSVTLLVDIRTIPRSRHNPQFNQEALADALEKAGIGYLHDKDLGGLRHPLKDSPNAGWKNESFRGYADYMQTMEFERALAHLLELARMETVAMMCAEGNPYRCHRSLVADALLVKGVKVMHISSMRPGREHRMTSFAEAIDGRVFYPVSSHSPPRKPG